MAIDFLYPQYEVVRNPARCIACRACERQCSNEVHAYDDELKMMIRRKPLCELPPLRFHLSHARFEDRQDRPHL